MKEAFSVHKKMENNEYCVFMLLDFPSATILNVMAYRLITAITSEKNTLIVNNSSNQMMSYKFKIGST